MSRSPQVALSTFNTDSSLPLPPPRSIPMSTPALIPAPAEPYSEDMLQGHEYDHSDNYVHSDSDSGSEIMKRSRSSRSSSMSSSKSRSDELVHQSDSGGVFSV